jgi:hypothetical protein
MRLNHRLDEIRKLTTFDNGILIYDNAGWWPWKSTFAYYTDDIVAFKYSTYLAIADSKGIVPGTAPKIWKPIRGPHPYLFLRDTAKVEDLKKCLNSDQAYIKTYAFGALAYRKVDGLFNVIIENMSDTTTIMQFTSDNIYEMHPAEIMIWSKLTDLTKEQRQILDKLIETKYKYLKEAKRFLKEK